MKIVVAALILAGITLVAPQSTEARQYGNGGQVVHTRRAPVVFHRVLPPFRGQHVYQPGR